MKRKGAVILAHVERIEQLREQARQMHGVLPWDGPSETFPVAEPHGAKA
jgi:hypothetical protein